jgi:hypothetical protein
VLPNFLPIVATDSTSSPLCAHPPPNFSNMNDSSYLTDSPTRVQREKLIKKEVDERIQWVLARESELKAEEIRLEEMKRELEESAKKVQHQNAPTTTTAKGSLSCFVRFFFVFTNEVEIII